MTSKAFSSNFSNSLYTRLKWVVAPNLNVNVRNGSRAADRKCQAEMENVYESESSFGHSKIMKSVWLLARMHRNLNAIRRCNSIKWHLFRIYLQNWQLSFNNIAQWNGLASTFILHIRISFGLVFFFKVFSCMSLFFVLFSFLFACRFFFPCAMLSIR